MIAVGHRRERAVERQQLHAMARQVEVADDLWTQQRDDVGGDRKFEPGKHFFGDGGAAEHVPPLEDYDLASRTRQISSARQPVVAATDDNRVVLHWFAGPLRRASESILSTCRLLPPSMPARFSCARASAIVTGRATTPSARTKHITSMSTTRSGTPVR